MTKPDPTISIAPNLSLGIDTITSTRVVVAKKRVGKTYFAQKIAEGLLAADQQIVVIDLTSAWWGLQSSADGTRPGYPITIFGGRHGNVPLESTAGEDLAEAIVADRFSAVLDVRLLKKGQRIRFIADFLEALYDKNVEPMHLFMDEADAYIPQRSFSVEESRALGAADELVRRGGIGGIGVTMITQRAAVLNKNVISQVDTMAILQTTHPKDIDTVQDWMEHHTDDKKLITEITKSLGSLPRGDAWYLDPENKLFERISVSPKITYDSGRTPKVGETIRPPKVLAQIDLDRLGEVIAATVQRAKESDPKLLRAKIVELEKQLAAKPGKPGKGETKIVEVEKIVEKRVVEHLNVDAVMTQLSRLDAVAHDIGGMVDGLRRQLEGVTVGRSGAPATAPAFVPPVVHIPPPRERAAVVIPAGTGIPDGTGPRASAPPADNTDYDRQLLRAIAVLGNAGIPVSAASVAAWLGIHPKTGTFLGAITRLREVAYLDGLELTAAARDFVIDATETATAKTIRERFRVGLSEFQAKIIDVIATIDKAGIGKSSQTIAVWLGIHPKTGTFLKDTRKLRSRRYIDGLELSTIGAAAAIVLVPPTLADLTKPLDDGQKKIVETVAEWPSGAMESAAVLAKTLGLHPKTGTFLQNLTALRSRGVLTAGWPIQLTQAMRPA